MANVGEEEANAEAEEVLMPEEQALREGEKNFLRVIRVTKKRLRSDKDAIIAVTGERGVGKSVLSIKLGCGINHKFSINKNVLFDPNVEELRKRIYENPDFSCEVIDELIRIGYRRNWMRKGNKLLNELFNLCRYKHQASIVCIPNFNDIDSDFQDLVTLWIFVVDRGVAVLFRADKNPFVKDKWHLNENEKLLREEFKGKSLYHFTNAEFIRALEKTPNFVAWFTFPDWSPEEKAEYDLLKKPYELRGPQDEDINVGVSTAVKTRIKKTDGALANTIKALLEAGVSEREVLEKTGLSPQWIGRLLSSQGQSLIELKKELKLVKNAREPVDSSEAEKFDVDAVDLSGLGVASE